MLCFPLHPSLVPLPTLHIHLGSGDFSYQYFILNSVDIVCAELCVIELALHMAPLQLNNLEKSKSLQLPMLEASKRDSAKDLS